MAMLRPLLSHKLYKTSICQDNFFITILLSVFWAISAFPGSITEHAIMGNFYHTIKLLNGAIL